MEKIVSTEEIDKIRNDLNNGTSPKRRSAAIKIGKLNISDLGNELLQSYIKEKDNDRTWETQVEMIRALGKLKYKPAIETIQEVLQNPNSDSARTVAATIAYIRLKRYDNNDAQPVIDLISNDPNKSIISGAFSVLAFDDMKPSVEQINIILDFVKKIGSYLDDSYIKGTTDPRIYILSASVNWDKNDPKLKDFINNASQNPRINQYMNRILKGKKAPFAE